MLYLMDNETPRAITGQQLREMRCWLEDAGFPILANGTDMQVVRDVARSYPGGIEGFLVDEPKPEVREASACDPYNDPSWGM